MARPTRLTYQGKRVTRYDADGNVALDGFDRLFQGIPTRDLDERDIRKLSDEDLANATGGPDPLYIDPDAKKAAPKVVSTKPPAKTIGPAKRDTPAKEPKKAAEVRSSGGRDDFPTVATLRKDIKKRGLDAPSKATKADLIAILAAPEPSPVPPTPVVDAPSVVDAAANSVEGGGE